MPERYKVEAWMLERMKAVLVRTYLQWREHKSEATLSILLIRIYEVGIAFYGFEFNDNSMANFGALKAKVGKLGSVRLKNLRNDLVHNMENIRNFNLTIFLLLNRIDSELLDTIYCFCTGEQSSIYLEISEYLGGVGVFNMAQSITRRVDNLDGVESELSEDVYNNLPTLIKGDASLKQLLPILEISVKKLLRGEN